MNNHKQIGPVMIAIKKILILVLVIAVIVELYLFPSVENGVGCIMAIVCFVVFQFFLKDKYIIHYPFTFLLYLSIFLYRYLPLVATLIEYKPITYGFERPLQTFIGETIWFLIASMAFYMSCRFQKRSILKSYLDELGFYKKEVYLFWLMGFFGLFVKLYTLSAGSIEYGNVSGKFLHALQYFIHAPILLLFPTLSHIKYKNYKLVYLYTAIIFILMIASNSRQAIIEPIGVILLLFFLVLVKNKLSLKEVFSLPKLAGLVVLLFLIIKLLGNISLAMLYNRSIREDVSRKELFVKTFETLQNPDLMARLNEVKNKKENELSGYHNGWTETYLDNFMLNRYANMRITDQTVYYAEKRGHANAIMQVDLSNRILALLPTPILSFFKFKINKKDFQNSRGDILYGKGIGGFRVTSHLGDGLATFGYWYFPIQFIFLIITFKLTNVFTFYKNDTIVYAPFALMSIFSFLGFYRNANGIMTDFGYLLRGFIQDIFTYLLIFTLLSFLIRLLNFNKKN